jgi:cell division protein FtsL
MKTFITIAGLCLLGVTPVRAQWTVYDPAVHTQIILNGVQEIAKFVQVINNQVQQIQTLTAQVNEFKKYESVFGDPSKVVLVTAPPLIDDLRKTEVGKTLTALESAADAGQAMVYTANGLYRSVGTEFTTPGGQTVTRRREPYVAVAAVQKTTDNYLAVSTDAGARRVVLKQQIAATTEQLRSATTDAEVQKLSVVLAGQSAALESTDQEISQATASAVVQDIANRADAQRQVEAKKEQQHAEFTEAVGKYGQTFRLLNAPVTFPTR